MPFAPKSFTWGLLLGLVIPPILTKTVVQPLLIQRWLDDIDDIKRDLDYLGWHVRNQEQQRGYKDEDVYIPVSYFQGH